MLGILLHIVVTSVSEIGLDAHVHATYVTVEDGGGGERLDWGHTRPVDSQASDPDYSPESGLTYWAWHAWLGLWIDFLGNNSDALQTGSLLLAAFMMFIVWRSTEKLYGTEAAARLTALVSINPALIFAAGRVYPEEMMLISISIALLTLLLGLRTGGKGMHLLWLMAPAAVLFGATVKGIDPTLAVILFILGFVVFALDGTNELLVKFTRRPHRAFLFSSAMVFIVFLGFALFSPAGLAVSSLREAPLRFISAVIFSILDVVIIFMLFGMVLWPFLKDSISSASVIIDREAGLLAAVIGAMTTGLVLYVAALWTHESLIWNAEWPWMVWTMGNNGRYATLLVVPCFWYIMRLHQLTNEDESQINKKNDSLDNLDSSWKSVLIGICLVLPLSLLAAFHGQTSWTSDAAQYLDSEMQDSEDFLFISEATLGMHWLYSFHLELDPDGSRNITGHWRSIDSGWQDELSNGVKLDNRGNLSKVNWLVLSPSLTEDFDEINWQIVESSSAPWMNGGGEWVILKRTVQVL